MKILLLGPPASGKGTLGEKLVKVMKVPLISVGQQLRNIPEDHPRYAEINELMDRGDPAPKDFIAELLEKRLSMDDCANGFVMDGWGRNMIDLEYYDPDYDKVLYITLSRESALKRITGRRICDVDGKVYNIYTLPKEELEKCKGELVQRDDDTEEVVGHRYDLFIKDTYEVVDFFRNQGKLLEVSGEPGPEEVYESALRALGIND